MTKLAFVDTETTGLDPDRHEIWDVGLITENDHGGVAEHQWFLPVDLSKADPIALNIGRFRERHPGIDDFGGTTHPHEFAEQFATLTHGAHLVGNVVSFDAERLSKLLRKWGECPTWHYHLIDVEPLVVGYLNGRRSMSTPGGPYLPLPWKSDDLSQAIGVPLPLDEDRHTALGDARWARRLYRVVMS